MGENTSGHEGKGLDPFAPVTHGLEYIEDHRRPWSVPGGSLAPEELRRLAGQVIIMDDLPQHTEVDPNLRAAASAYPPLQSRMPFPPLSRLVDYIRSVHGHPQ